MLVHVVRIVKNNYKQSKNSWVYRITKGDNKKIFKFTSQKQIDNAMSKNINDKRSRKWKTEQHLSHQNQW